jgi:hypothetical protein
MKKLVIAFLLHLHLIVLAADLALSETNNRDNSTQIASLNATAKQANSTENTKLNESSTISGVDKNSTENANGTLVNETTTVMPTTTTTDLEQLLIPPATVEAQIVKANISSKKPSRLQAA